MFYISKNQVVISELFLQSSFDCGNSCRNCYVKANKNNNPLLPIVEWQKLLLSFLLTPNKTNQISISLDTPPPGAKKDRMIDIVCAFSSAAEIATHTTPIHLTTHSVATFEKYLSLGVDLSFADEVSFSNIAGLLDSKAVTYLLAYKKKINAIVRSSANIEKTKRYLSDAYPFPNAVYIILDKPCDYQREYAHACDIEQSLADTTVANKIYMDICDRDFMCQTCSAGISKFQVWPDGGVSGCPYQKATTPPAKTYKEVMNNIVLAHQINWFDTCPMKGK